MKIINAHQLPFLLDRNTNTDEVLKISIDYGDIMLIEFPDGQEIAFGASEAQIDWYNNLPEPINPNEDKEGCPGCPFCGIAPEPGTQHYEDMLCMYPEFYQTEIEARKSLAEKAARAEAERRSDERHALKERGWEAPPVDFTTFCNCAGGANPGYDAYGLAGAYCENCGCII
jgi:hypothetical protein